MNCNLVLLIARLYVLLLGITIGLYGVSHHYPLFIFFTGLAIIPLLWPEEELSKVIIGFFLGASFFIALFGGVFLWAILAAFSIKLAEFTSYISVAWIFFIIFLAYSLKKCGYLVRE